MPNPSMEQLSPPVGPGPNIVKAWFESAINPLLQGLEIERGLLAKCTFTWRAHSGQMLAIMPVRSHLSYGKWANLDQFLSFYGDVEEMCKTHDRELLDLAQVCKRMYADLVSDEAFRDLVTAAFRSDRLALPAGQTRETFEQTHEISRVVEWVAEHVVNGSGPLGEHYSTAPIWNPFREELLALRTKAPFRDDWQSMVRSAELLLRTVDQLITSLSGIRNWLSVQFDVPPEPLEVSD